MHRTERGRTRNRVEYDQTMTHLHHAPELGVTLPPNFDTTTYQKMDNKARIAYAKQRVSPDTIITYQNKIGLAMSPQFGTLTMEIRGKAGTSETPVGLVIQKIPNTNRMYLSIIKDNGKHITTYPITNQRLNRLRNNDFWVLRTRTFYD